MGKLVEDFFNFFENIYGVIVCRVNLKCFKKICDSFENPCGLFKVNVTGFYRICKAV